MSESKLVFALWGEPHGTGLGQAVRDPALHAHLAASGVRRVQLDLDDAGPGSRLRRQCFERPVRAVVAVWTTGPAAAVTLLLRGVADEVAGWRVQERRLVEPPPYAGASTVVALVRRADDPAPTDDPWLERWLDHRAALAESDPAVLGHVQDVVLEPVTRGAPPVHAIVEETTEGGEADPRRLDRLVESVATLGGDRQLDLLPTSRCVLDLRS